MAQRLNDVLPPHTQSDYLVEWPNEEKIWPNGKRTVKINNNAPVRTWTVGWSGLTYAQTIPLEQHYNGVAGTGFGFEYRDIHSNLIFIVTYTSAFKRQLVRPNVKLYRIEHTLREVV